jgi:hypothetical protein
MKLDTNLFIWKVLFEPILHSNRLMNHVNNVSVAFDRNSLEFLDWLERDQTIISWINSTLSLPMLPYVVGATTAYKAWTRLSKRFGVGTKKHELTPKKRLLHIKKGSQSMQDYLKEFEIITNQLLSCGVKIGEEELQTYILNGHWMSHLIFSMPLIEPDVCL